LHASHPACGRVEHLLDIVQGYPLEAEPLHHAPRRFLIQRELRLLKAVDHGNLGETLHVLEVMRIDLLD
jgi:hypothetical protein